MGLMYFPRYIKREGRDYFYMTLRQLLPGPVLTAGTQGTAATPWQVKGLPQHGFPYALALAETTLGSGRRVRVLQIDPRMVTPFAAEAATPGGVLGPTGGGAATAEGSAAEGAPTPPTVLALDSSQAPAGTRTPSLWLTPDAFSVSAQAPLEGAVRLCSGHAPGQSPQARGALGVRQEAGMLVYVELLEPAQAVAEDDLTALLRTLGVEAVLLLDKPLAIALGGDTDWAGRPTRLSGPGVVLLHRKPGPGARRLFADTPVVPLKEWYPLQAKRIRYFKKKDPDSATSDGKP